jgi:hypothetical protein
MARDASHEIETTFPDEILLVSEDPQFVFEMQTSMDKQGLKVIGCLGPAHTHCNLIDDDSDCPLTTNAFLAIVDSPPSGVFNYHWKSEPAGIYAEKLARRHPECFVILCGAPTALAGASGEVAHVPDRAAALELLQWVAISYGFSPSGANGSHKKIRTDNPAKGGVR